MYRRTTELDGSRLQEDRAEKVGTRYHATPTAELDRDQLCSGQSLASARYLNGVRGRDGHAGGLSTRTQMVGGENVDLHVLTTECVSLAECVRLIQGEPRRSQDVDQTTDRVRSLSRIGQGIGIHGDAPDDATALQRVELDHSCPDESPVPLARSEIKQYPPDGRFALRRRHDADHRPRLARRSSPTRRVRASEWSARSAATTARGMNRLRGKKPRGAT